MPKVTEQPAVREIADRLGATPAQIGLAWLLARSPCVLLIPGTSSLAHLEENQAVLGVELDAEAMAQLNGIRG
jgi:aryl-alcohol dehydrogenase-like predicted oxidoreductase